MQTKPLENDVEQTVRKFGLRRKWSKAKRLFEKNLRHPSLHTELLEPRWRGIYSFRIDPQISGLIFY